MERVIALVLFATGLAGSVLFLALDEHARLGAPAPTHLLLDRRGDFLAELSESFDGPLGFWPVEEVPERVVLATVAIEDQRFFSHPGVDLWAIGRATWQNLKSQRRISGASTLAMQIARLQRPAPRTVSAKVIESATALALTFRYGRQAILGHYLTIAPYGNRIHGIRYAARRYLDKPVEDLSWAEIGFLAAIPQSPTKTNPHRWQGRRRAIARGQHILGLLFERKVISADELALARTQIAAISVPLPPRRRDDALHFILRVDRELKDQRKKDPLLRTSLDPALQAEARGQTEALLSSLHARGAENAALMVVDLDSFEVVAYVGSSSYFDPAHGGALDYANLPRASGSTLKPFIYALALDRKVITPASIVDDLMRAKGVTSNADREYLGPLLPRVALANSRNVPAVNLLYSVGAFQTYDLFADLGLHDRRVAFDHYGSGIAIGLLPVRLSDLLRAYTALAGDGHLHDLQFTQVATNRKEKEAPRVFSADSARQITLFLSDPLARLPTFPRMGVTEYPFPVALKTGTSQGNRDAWTVAYSKKWLVGAWVGRADATPMTGLGGSNSAGRLVRAMLTHLHREALGGLEDLAFATPKEHQPRRICERTGLLATEACEHTQVEWFLAGDAPVEPCDAHIALPIAPGSRDLRIFTQLGPRYAEWSQRRGYQPPPKGHPKRSDLLLGAAEDAVVRPLITQPENGARLYLDPEVPSGTATLGLSAVVDPRVSQLVWYVDGQPFRVVASPFSARWPLTPGEHVFEARVPYGAEASKPVRVRVE